MYSAPRTTATASGRSMNRAIVGMNQTPTIAAHAAP
jgi:hypothetical protein